MNLDETPNVEDIWLSVAKTANEEFLEDCCKRLKEEVDILVLPMAK